MEVVTLVAVLLRRGAAKEALRMLISEVVATSMAVSATRSRTAKVAELAALLSRAAHVSEEVLCVVTAYAGGTIRQRRTGVGWRSLGELPPSADVPSLEVVEVDRWCESAGSLSGSGAAGQRNAMVVDLFSRATTTEQAWLRGLLLGEVRQGASSSLVLDALAMAAGVDTDLVRRAAMLTGSVVAVAPLAFRGGEALAAVRIRAGTPISPMLASSAPTIAEAFERLGTCAIEAKLDGIRIQAHRHRGTVQVVTRSLDDITSRLPDVVKVVREMPVGTDGSDELVLDGEALVLGDDGRPVTFQETASRTAREGPGVVTPFFFDLMRAGTTDLLEVPSAQRWARLQEIVPPEFLVHRTVVDSSPVGEEFYREVVEAGHEGVVLKSLDAPYAAGRRGSAWIKVKPVHTFDLVVLAAEWGSGRRAGMLSNIHLGARTESGPVMVGKTFKGMTDQMLRWQTERFLALETSRSGHVVQVEPTQVVEVAIDGVQRSNRYPGGVALRFARVVRYRDDKSAAQAEELAHLKELL